MLGAANRDALSRGPAGGRRAANNSERRAPTSRGIMSQAGGADGMAAHRAHLTRPSHGMARALAHSPQRLPDDAAIGLPGVLAATPPGGGINF